MEVEQILDVADKIECLTGYLKLWRSGGNIPHELGSVINEADEFVEKLRG